MQYLDINIKIALIQQTYKRNSGIQLFAINKIKNIRNQNETKTIPNYKRNKKIVASI